MEKQVKIDPQKVKDVVGQFMSRPDVCDLYLDAWASLRTVRAGIGSDCRFEEAFPKNPSPEPLPFPKNARGETIIHPEEVEEGSERKYGERPRFDQSMESMTECVERAVKSFDGPEYVSRLLIVVHPLGSSRYRATPYPDDPFALFSDSENGPNVSQVTKKHQATTYLHVYRSFRKTLAREISNVQEKAS